MKKILKTYYLMILNLIVFLINVTLKINSQSTESDYFDYRIVEFFKRFHVLKIKNGISKYILREAMKPYSKIYNDMIKWDLSHLKKYGLKK